MEYDQFFDVSKPECECYSTVRTTLVVVTLVSLIIDCVSRSKTNSKMKALEAENGTLKNLILKSVDSLFLKALHAE